jgi:hypothetical protein
MNSGLGCHPALQIRIHLFVYNFLYHCPAGCNTMQMLKLIFWTYKWIAQLHIRKIPNLKLNQVSHVSLFVNSRMPFGYSTSVSVCSLISLFSSSYSIIILTIGNYQTKTRIIVFWDITDMKVNDHALHKLVLSVAESFVVIYLFLRCALKILQIRD